MQNQILEAIHARRSVRRYQSRGVEREKLEAVLDAAFHGPSARNLQPWHFTVIEDPALISVLEEGVRRAESNPQMHVFHGAPVVIMVSGQEENHWNQIDCGLATENLLLAAYSLGLGSCVVGFVMRYLNQPVAVGTLKRMRLPKGFRPLYAIAIGYPDEEPDARPREQKASWL